MSAQRCPGISSTVKDTGGPTVTWRTYGVRANRPVGVSIHWQTRSASQASRNSQRTAAA
jgi:hypothetical protein